MRKMRFSRLASFICLHVIYDEENFVLI